MSDSHQEYLKVLEDTGACLAKLTELAEEKLAVVRKDDLIKLDEIMKKEQAQALALRGLENKREKLMKELGLADTRLSELVGKYPAALQDQAKKTTDALSEAYSRYRTAADTARALLESNLRDVEKVIEEEGGMVSGAGAGYAAEPDIEPPAPMKTDFRA